MIQFDEKYINELIDKTSKALVGKTMKRFEISGNNDKVLKKNIKELIYEQFRDLKLHMEAHSKGIEIVSVCFKSKEERDEE